MGQNTDKTKSKPPPCFWQLDNDLIAVNIVNHFDTVQCSVWADMCTILLLHVSHHSSVLLFWRCPRGQSLSRFRLRWLSMSSARLIEPPLLNWSLATFDDNFLSDHFYASLSFSRTKTTTLKQWLSHGMLWSYTALQLSNKSNLERHTWSTFG